MSFNKNIKDQGFTIVELLIVIVVIGILAAITIVAYNGIQTRGKAAAAQALANGIVKKAEIYNTEPTTTGYPATLATLTGAASSTSYYVEASSVTLQTTAMSAAPTTPEKTIVFNKCGHTNSTTAATSAATITVQTGVRVDYWNNGSAGNVTAGVTSGYGNPPTNTFPISCWPALT